MTLTLIAIALVVVPPVVWLIADQWGLLTGRDSLAEFEDVTSALDRASGPHSISPTRGHVSLVSEARNLPTPSAPEVELAGSD